MALEFNEMSKQQQWGVIGVVCAVFIGVFYMYVWSPTSEQATTLRGEISTIQLENQRTRQVAAQLSDLEAEVSAMETRLATLSNILPEEQQTDELLRRLEAAAAHSNLDLRSTSYPAAVLHDFYAEMPIELDLVGTFHDLAMFFDRVSKFGRIVTVGQVSINALADGGADTIQAQCTAATFFFLPDAVVVDPDAAAVGAQGGGR